MSTGNTRAYIANFSGHDYTALMKWAQEAKYVTKGYVSFGSLDRVKYRVAEAIADSKPEDYLVLSGRAIICVLAAIMWIEKHGKVKLLVWDEKKGGQYRELEVNKSSLIDLLMVTSSNKPVWEESF